MKKTTKIEKKKEPVFLIGIPVTQEELYQLSWSVKVQAMVGDDRGDILRTMALRILSVLQDFRHLKFSEKAETEEKQPKKTSRRKR